MTYWDSAACNQLKNIITVWEKILKEQPELAVEISKNFKKNKSKRNRK